MTSFMYIVDVLRVVHQMFAYGDFTRWLGVLVLPQEAELPVCIESFKAEGLTIVDCSSWQSFASD